MKKSYSAVKLGLYLLLATGLLATSLYFGLAFYFSNLILVPGHNPQNIQQIRQGASAYSIPPTSLNIQSPNSAPLQAWYFERYAEPTCVIIFTHGWKSSRLGIEKFLPAFDDTHCNYLTYDIRAHATHPAKYSTGGILEKHELLRISKYLQQTLNINHHQIAWFGLSLGASTSLEAAALNFSPAFIVADSPFQDWDTAIFERGIEMYGNWVAYMRPGVALVLKLRAGINYRHASVLDIAANIQSPVLLIHSASDRDTAPEQSAAIFELLNKDKSQFHLTNWGSKHGKDIETRPEAYKQIVNEFIRTYAAHFYKAKN